MSTHKGNQEVAIDYDWKKTLESLVALKPAWWLVGGDYNDDLIDEEKEDYSVVAYGGITQKRGAVLRRPTLHSKINLFCDTQLIRYGAEAHSITSPSLQCTFQRITRTL